MRKNTKYSIHQHVASADAPSFSSRFVKAAQLATIACASFLVFCNPAVSAQETEKLTAKQIIEERRAAEKKAAEEKKAAAQAHADALQMARSNEYGKAVELLEPYAKQPMAHVPITGDYLVFLIWSGDNNKATREFESLPAAFPKSTYLLRNMAKAYYDQNNFESAATLYADTLKQAPKDEEAQKGHVLSLYHAGKAEESAARLNDYMKVNPDSTTLIYLKPQILR